MKLVDRRGNAHEVEIGLVDKSGAFFLLLDSDKPSRYLRFTDEASVLNAYATKCDKLEKQVAQLQDKLDKAKERTIMECADRAGCVSTYCAAMLIGASPTHTRQLIKSGVLEGTRENGDYTVPLHAVENYVLNVMHVHEADD